MGRGFALVLLSALLQSCVSRNTVRSAPPEAGLQGTYREPPGKIRPAAIEALNETGFRVEEDVSLGTAAWRLVASRPGRFARVLGESRGAESSVRVLVEPPAAALAQEIHERLARKIGRPAPAPAGGTVDVGVERSFRSSLPVCFDAAARVCRDRDYSVQTPRQASDGSGSLSARGRGFEVTLNFAPTADRRSRVIVQVQGRAPPENRDEALALLDKLRTALLEPLD